MLQPEGSPSAHTRHGAIGCPDPLPERLFHLAPTQIQVIGAELERCLVCEGTHLVRKGVRRNTFETLQLWYCQTCDRVFSPRRTKGKKYPLKVVLECLMLYYRGENRERVVARIKERLGITVPVRTLTAWLSEYKALTTYARLRSAAIAAYKPTQVIRSVRLHHQQVYHYHIHRAKLAAVLGEEGDHPFNAVGEYLIDMATHCPHHLFQNESRASQGRAAFDLGAVEISAKRNHACRMADLVLQAVTHHKRRHDELQRFMRLADSVTVAVEVPIHLSPEDIAHYREVLGSDVRLESATVLTGHIDVLQIRNGAVHILDYKPGAHREKPIPQLMVYALALSRRTSKPRRPACVSEATSRRSFRVKS